MTSIIINRKTFIGNWKIFGMWTQQPQFKGFNGLWVIQISEPINYRLPTLYTSTIGNFVKKNKMMSQLGWKIHQSQSLYVKFD